MSTDSSGITIRRVSAAEVVDLRHQVLRQGLPTLKIGVLAGPALPPDMVKGEYSSAVVASTLTR